MYAEGLAIMAFFLLVVTNRFLLSLVLLFYLTFTLISLIGDYVLDNNLSYLISNLDNLSINSGLLLMLFWIVKFNSPLMNFFLIQVSTLILLTINLRIKLSCFDYTFVNELNHGFFQNLLLNNGVLSIHPLYLLSSYVFFYLIMLIVNYDKLLFYFYLDRLRKQPLPILNPSVSHSHKSFKYNSSSGLSKLTLAIVLGMYWSYQEENWGGYWSWDPIELFSLLPLVAYIYFIHNFQLSKVSFTKSVFLMLFILSITLVRLNMLSSIHGFIQSKNLNLKVNTVLMLFALKFSVALVSLSYFYKFSNRSIIVDYFYGRYTMLLKSLAFVFVIFIFLFIYNPLLYNSPSSIKHHLLVLATVLLVFFSFLVKPMSLTLIFPLVDMLCIKNLIISKKYKLYLNLYHLTILLFLIYFLLISHLTLITDLNVEAMRSLNYSAFNSFFRSSSTNLSIKSESLRLDSNTLVINNLHLNNIFYIKDSQVALSNLLQVLVLNFSTYDYTILNCSDVKVTSTSSLFLLAVFALFNQLFFKTKVVEKY